MSTAPRNWALGAPSIEAAPVARRLGVKDNIDVVGVPTRVGSRLLGTMVGPALRDATVVARLRAAGWVPTARTVMVELAYGTHGVNPFDGTPENVLDASLVPGGSSSGSAVGVGLGLVDLALGTDTGGSVRIPAAANGVLGLKPSYGLLPTSGVAPLAPSLDTVGLIAPDIDRLSEGARALGIDELVGDWPLVGVGVGEPNVDGRLGELAERLVSAPVDLGELARAGGTILDFEAAATWGWLLRQAHRLDPWVRRRLEGALAVDGAAYLEARARLHAWRAAFEAWFADSEALALVPTLLAPPGPLSAWSTLRLNELTIPWNALGLPALSVPVGGGAGPWRTSRVPFSVQVVGPFGADGRLVHVARRLVQAFRSAASSHASTQSRSASRSGGSSA
ncbi:Amidase [Acidimicrobium ferrooxidans DSM 10331]|uniref:Amidase n=1 Tax=Acidimicrobium ferrooxidans (strain DSM 10331 / JCM 15462 / NBRC 103882 / ICP) TaxID=525909 RepID=C7LZG8_ACIFD|nr:amidase [Acidimicrobium ferrooxidans]ACU54126.1 Amidase [Acidimicrobium ferrooxidans DSM 10331]